MTAHAERSHALLSASKAAQWIACPPSARLQEGIPDQRSEYAEEGIAAHELAELKIRNQILDEIGIGPLDGFRDLNPHYSAEMEEAVQRYVDVVAERYNEALSRSSDAVFLLEERLDFSYLVPGGFGTGDAVIIADGVMEIIDLKYGKGVPVSAEGNPQMRLYALGALDGFGWMYDIREVHMTIVQPRLDSISTDIIDVDSLREWGESVVRPAAELAWRGEGEFKAGEHCRWCKVKATCRARAEENMKALEYEFQDPALLTLDEIGQILHIAQKLHEWAKDVEEYAFDRAVAGERVPGWKLVEGRSNRTITDKEAARAKLEAAGLEADRYLKTDLLGISELEKRIGKKELAALIGDLIQKPPGKPVLVPETDKRPELNRVEADFASEKFDLED